MNKVMASNKNSLHVHTSLRMSLLAPRSTIVHALGSRHSTRYVKYSSPIFRTSKRPHPVPTSVSFSSSVRLQMVAPHALWAGIKLHMLVVGVS